MEVRIVCDNLGNTSNAGAIYSVDAYTFWAKATTNGASAGKIKMVLPVGGDTSGLYRFPRIGEKVLVENVGTGSDEGWYLLGYVPDDNQKFSPSGTGSVTDLTETEVTNKQGQVFRYKNTNEAVMPGKYSEIGFYNKETHWAKKGATVDFDDMGKEKKHQRKEDQSERKARNKGKKNK